MTRMSRLVLHTLVSALALPTCAFAQAITVEQLVAIAIERAPDLQAARADVRAASGLVTQASLRPNPMLDGRHQQSGMTFTTIDVEWPLALLRRPARVALAQREADVTSLIVLERERLLAASVREQAGRLLAAQRALDVTNEALVAARRMRELLERRATEGGAPKLDANLATVEALRLEADAALASGEVEAATIELRALAGLAPDAPLVLSESLETLVRTAAASDTTAAAAIEARPDVQQAAAGIGVADARAEQARREAGTDVTLVGGYVRSSYKFDQFGLDQRGMSTPIQNSDHAIAVGAKVSLPWFNRNQGLLAAAQAERDGAEATLAARQRNARAEVDAAVARDRQAQRAVTLYASDVRTLARQNVEVILEGYDLGRFRLAELLTEQRRYLEVEAGYTDVLARAYRARADMVRAFGGVK